MIGDPVSVSISHKIYPPLFKERGVAGSFERIKLPVSSLEGFFKKAPPYDFITVTMPHKQSVIPFCHTFSEDAKAIGAVNFITNIGGELTGFNFDGVGALDPIEERVFVKGKRVVVLGAGGAARAAIFESKKRGGLVTVVNRTREKGRLLSREFDVEYSDNVPDIFDVLINATSVGMDSSDTTKLIENELLLNRSTILDMASRDGNCLLKKQTITNGGEYISGTEMVLSLTHFGFGKFLQLYNSC